MEWPGVEGRKPEYGADLIASSLTSGEGASAKECQLSGEGDRGVPPALPTPYRAHALEVADL